tara:strand:- start:32994 stop:33797 length:804 start_codon:yes stop_codon:yes gene_type:complete
MFLLLLFITTVYGFSNYPRIVLLPGYGCNVQDYKEITATCNENNVEVDIVSIERHDWLSIGKNIVNPQFWKNDMTPETMFGWYLDKAKHMIEMSIKKNDNKPIILCGHSAGGWLGRALLGNGTFYKTNCPSENYVSTFITMGTPNNIHLNKDFDTTRGCLTYINNNYPDAYLKSKIRYVTIGSDVKSIKTNEKGLFNKKKYILDSYLTVMGKTDENLLKGDGIVPIDAMHLEGSFQKTYHDVYHFKRPGKKWYGDREIVQDWLNIIL